MHGEGIVHGDLKGVGPGTALNIILSSDSIFTGKRPDRQAWPCLSCGLRAYHDYLGLHKFHFLSLV